ncbi:AraC family transcriptional regulator [Dyadobacter sp. CY312]|uniref:helix-turn-helix domain-containing protein n=1 Tax=Dyadobacter sp. CY312 TaxID=2907303 RepID=UPI001F28054C|nr:response regulator transcription factor [Dyadobacter sp. CY312]MCE7039063.1 helix-turn-helix transcriptional regulator [Dyadobacter sp. CY312]
MKKVENNIRKFTSLSDMHRMFGLNKPLHPLISFSDISNIHIDFETLPPLIATDFYKISYKLFACGTPRYGQSVYDFSEGGLAFTAPHQVLESPGADHELNSGYLLLIHPDFFLGFPLAKKIKQFGFFSYDTNEALHLSDTEKETIFSVFKMIDEELKKNIDGFSQDVIISQIELLLSYSNRFYNRQFITRKAAGNRLLQQLDEILEQCFDQTKSAEKGVPTVQYLSEQLHISPGYLSDMLRALIGQNAQQYIHQKLIEKAKEKLSASELSVSEIAYELGFEHSQSFSKLFKSKTNQSPLEFRASFN